MTKSNIEESRKFNTKQKKTDTKEYLLHDSFHIKFRHTQNLSIIRGVVILSE